MTFCTSEGGLCVKNKKPGEHLPAAGPGCREVCRRTASGGGYLVGYPGGGYGWWVLGGGGTRVWVVVFALVFKCFRTWEGAGPSVRPAKPVLGPAWQPDMVELAVVTSSV